MDTSWNHGNDTPKRTVHAEGGAVPSNTEVTLEQKSPTWKIISPLTRHNEQHTGEWRAYIVNAEAI